MHYAVLGLPFLVKGKKFYLKNQYTCSSYTARVLEECGLPISDKHFSLVTPKDVYEYKKYGSGLRGKTGGSWPETAGASLYIRRRRRHGPDYIGQFIRMTEHG